ncbi:MAG: hypothetical protein GWP45_12370 [Proteobacteria bacterium]|nr:hypothetical protein [Pseudomonadota bacterium]
MRLTQTDVCWSKSKPGQVTDVPGAQSIVRQVANIVHFIQRHRGEQMMNQVILVIDQ